VGLLHGPYHQQAVQLALEGEQVGSILKAITKTSKASPAAKHMLAEHQAVLGLKVNALKINNNSHWGSAHAMFKRLISSLQAVSASLAALHGLHKPILPNLTSNQWSIVHQLVQVLKPLKKSTNFLSHEWATLSAVMPLISNVICLLFCNQPQTEDGPVKTTFKKDLVNDLSFWALLFTNVGDTLLMAVYLDNLRPSSGLLIHMNSSPPWTMQQPASRNPCCLFP